VAAEHDVRDGRDGLLTPAQHLFEGLISTGLVCASGDRNVHCHLVVVSRADAVQTSGWSDRRHATGLNA
jgi:hypothetical protein